MALRCAVILLILILCSGARAETQCSGAFTDIYADVAPSVVRVLSVKIDPYKITDRVSRNAGAGFVMEDGHIVTTAHLVWEANVITVLMDAQVHTASLVGADAISDIAVLALGEDVELPAPVTWGDSDLIEVAEDVLAIGHPASLQDSASRGIISGKSRILPISPLSWLVPLLQTDAAILPGSSGGPLVNSCGQVIGINSMVITGRAGVGFAVPSNLARAVAAELIAQGRIVRPWHGIHGRVIDSALRAILKLAYGADVPAGFLVETVEPGSPAQIADIRGGVLPIILGEEEYLIGGDIITHVNDSAVDTLDAVIAIAKAMRVGDRITIRLRRGEENHSVEAVLPERPVLPGDARRFSN